MALSFQELSLSGAVLACFQLSCLFVVSLYIVDPGLSRNHPKTVRRRLLVIVGVCICSPVLLWVWSDNTVTDGQSIWEILGVHTSDGLICALFLPLLLVLILYAGPIVQALSEGDSLVEHVISERTDIVIRNYVFAPFAEEFVFRACMMPLLLPSLGVMWTIFCCPLFFGLAHLHHVLEWFRRNDGTPLSNTLLGVLLQVVYTSIFGVFSAFLYFRTNHLVSPVVSHALCNILGLPHFESLPNHPYRNIVLVVYVAGLLTFLCLLWPLTSPSLYHTID